MVEVRVTTGVDFTALGPRWRELELRANGSFFQSWTWVGCLFAERCRDPLLVEATEAGRTVALGLFNRSRRRLGPSRLYLSEAGSPRLDCPYVEQNGILTAAGREVELAALCLQPLLAWHELVLSGVGPSTLTAIGRIRGRVVITRSQASPFVDLAAIRRNQTDYLSGRSANTRQQLRRSDRFYQRQAPIRLQQADTLAAAHAMLDRLAELHQASWQARGKPGSFAEPFFHRFHHALIEDGLPQGQIALLQVSCGETLIGLLYNFIHRGRMSAYQSGFAYDGQQAQARPGLTCHHQAIRHAQALGLEVYDFLAGDDRYKRSLADQAHQQAWVIAGPVWSPRLLLRSWLGR